jgi:hypothetical protein
MSIETIPYAGWSRCLRLSDGRIEAVATLEVGPRILRFGRVGGPNLLHEDPALAGLTGGSDWRPYGGHRLWHAPEAKPRTYAPDNGPVDCEVQADRAVLTQAVEPSTGIRKTLELGLVPGGLELVHRLANLNPWPVELAPWAITVMAPGGVAILPQEPFAPHPDFPDTAEPGGVPGYLPVRSMVLWSYTRLSDPRWDFRDRFVLVKQDPALSAPLKFGVDNRRGWCAYLNAGGMLVKRFVWREGAVYPDSGCNNEVFTNREMLEVETLGPLAVLAPGAAVEHRERWEYREPASLEAALQSLP